MGDYTTLVVILWVLCAFVGWSIGSSKGQAGAGLVLGALLGIIGILIVAVMKPSAEHIAANAPPPQPGKWWPDPYGRHAQRYYDGTEWTNHIIDANGQQGVESL